MLACLAWGGWQRGGNLVTTGVLALALPRGAAIVGGGSGSSLVGVRPECGILWG